MDAEIRNHLKNGTLSLIHLKRAGFGIAWVAGEATRNYLKAAGWIVTEISKETTGVDCGMWHHCGPSCCGTCPKCGDDYDKQNGYRTYLVSPGVVCSNTAAKSLVNKAMNEVDKLGLAAQNWRKHASEWKVTVKS